jgi:hypothetical protein
VTTERYDNQKPEALMAAAKLLETGETFKNLSGSDSNGDSERAAGAVTDSANALTELDNEVGVDDGVRAGWRAERVPPA